MVIFNVWCCFIEFVIIFLNYLISLYMLGSCSYLILCIYCSFLYFRICFHIQNVKAYIFSLSLMGLSIICEPKTPFKLEHGLQLDDK
jgi:hypothetical protein